ncbi:hypothetical protein AUC44_01230 [Deinococcus actinosclerus]|uniref:Uncharacterized protein n=1 Tax=Deinococcus actinosclerus TaxID=1768108 RepID=A0ABM5X1T4_9DEIO|nr:hypothetical protein AUC44_01230 [Deinococcus actinosclerus]
MGGEGDGLLGAAGDEDLVGGGGKARAGVVLGDEVAQVGEAVGVVGAVVLGVCGGVAQAGALLVGEDGHGDGEVDLAGVGRADGGAQRQEGLGAGGGGGDVRAASDVPGEVAAGGEVVEGGDGGGAADPEQRGDGAFGGEALPGREFAPVDGGLEVSVQAGVEGAGVVAPAAQQGGPVGRVGGAGLGGHGVQLTGQSVWMSRPMRGPLPLPSGGHSGAHSGA